MSQLFPFNSNDFQNLTATPRDTLATWKPIFAARARRTSGAHLATGVKMSRSLSSIEKIIQRFYREYPGRLRRLRQKLNLSEAQAAKDHGVTLHTYRRWEAGFRPSGSAKPMLKFCKKHGLSLDYYEREWLPMTLAQ